MKRENYKTKQKEIIQENLKKIGKDFTIKELYEKCKEEIGLTTVYRYVDKLVEEKMIKKIIKQDGKTYYQYLEECEKENHFYLKCENCEKMIHIDCDCIEELSSHILKHHQFQTNKKNIIIEGLCKKCQEMERGE